MPFGLGKKRQKRLNLRGERWRSNNSGQDAEARSIVGLHLRCECLRAFHKQRPRLDFAKFGHRLRAIRIVKIQDRSLREHIRGPKARRMIGVAFDLGRTTFVAFHQQTDRVCAKRHRRGIELWLPEGHPIGLLDVRHDVLLRSAAAPGKARKCQRCRHQLQEIAPVDGVVPF